MRVTTKVRYALRAMIELANMYDMGPVMVDRIARNQTISRKYLDNLLTSLRRAGLVTSVRGSKGGYVMAKPPDQVTAYDVAVAVEGEISVVDCENDPKACPNVDTCATRELWMELSARIRKTLMAVTVKDLLERSREKVEKVTIMYNI